MARRGDVDTLVVAPMDAGRVSANEAGTSQPQVVLVHLLAATPADRFEPITVGRLSVKAMGQVDRLLRTVLQLP